MSVALAAHNNTTALPASVAYAVNLPASINAGDLLLVWIITANAPPTAIPSGWAAVAGATTTSTLCNVNCYSKTATGSEGATATWTLPNLGSQTLALSARVTAWNSVEATHAATGYGAAPVDSLSTLSANALVIGVAASIPDAGTATSTPPATWTEYEDTVAVSSFRQGSLSSVAAVAAGAVSGTWALSGNGLWATSLLSISAAAAGPATSGHLTVTVSGTAQLTVVQVAPKPVISRVLEGEITITPFRESSITITGGNQ